MIYLPIKKKQPLKSPKKDLSTLPYQNFFTYKNVYIPKLKKMKTYIKLPALVIIFTFIVCCTNNNRKNKAYQKETTTIILDTYDTNNYNNLKNDPTYLVWTFRLVNNEDINDYVYESSPFLTISLDSTFVLINTGCNYYIGECSFDNNIIKFEKIKLKEEICPIDALEREIIYMLESSNHYLINKNDFILFNNDKPIGLLTKDTTNFNYIYP